MRGFSLLGRTLPPDALAELLTEFREVVTPVVFELGGAVDKFIGDGALIVFGSMEQRPDDAARAIQCGHRILDAVSSWSEHRQRAGQPAVRVGIGRSEEHTSELQSLMRIPYAVFCLKKTTHKLHKPIL